MMKLSLLGEDNLIQLVRDHIERSADPRGVAWQQLLLGIGDDAAAWRGTGSIQLATTDTLVQDVHFDLRVTTWEELGWKAMAVNLSDIAAMGGVPEYALLSLALPGELDTQDFHGLIDGLVTVANEFGVAIAGGNLARAHSVVLTVTVMGRARNDAVLRRSTASPGEAIAVTGHPGLSAAGLQAARGIRPIPDSETGRMLRRSHFRPVPRVREAQTLLDWGVSTAIDMSDGLLADLNRLCKSSGVGARIELERLPVHPALREYFPDFYSLALAGGEDYELLFTAKEDTLPDLGKALDCTMTVIGRVTQEESPNRVVVVDGTGNIVPCADTGWDHFRENGQSGSGIS